MAEKQDVATPPPGNGGDVHAMYIALLRTLCKAEGGTVCDSPPAGAATAIGHTPAPGPAVSAPTPAAPVARAVPLQSQPVAAVPQAAAGQVQQQAPSGPGNTAVMPGAGQAGPAATPSGIVGANVVPGVPMGARENKDDVGKARDELVAIREDELKDARQYVYKEMNTQWKAYERTARDVLSEYTKRAQNEKEVSEAMVQLALVPLFFFGSGMVGEVVKRAGPLIRPVLEGAKIAVGRIDKIAGAKFRPDLASEVIKEAFKLARVAVSKDITSASTSMETMVVYTKTFENSLPDAFKALDQSIFASKNIDGLAAILAAIQTMTPGRFEKEYRAEVSKFEKQVVPTLLKVDASSDVEGSPVHMSKRNARIKIGSKAYRAQVSETMHFEGLVPKSKFQHEFVCWIEFQIDEDPKKGPPLELTAAQIKLPSERPPEAALVSTSREGAP